MLFSCLRCLAHIQCPPARVALAVLAFALAAPGMLRAEKPAPEKSPAKPAVDQADLEFFEKKIRPVLVEQCYECHSAESKVLQGNLRLDLKAGWEQGGDSGPAIEPGDPDNSLLLMALRYEGVEMPPRGQLSPEIVADFEHWIRRGAPDPRVSGTVAKSGIDLEKGREFWAFRPIANPRVPTVRDAAWPLNDIDRFILAKVEAAKLRPALDADRATWLRRVTYDLIGLPPETSAVEAFLADASPDAYEKVVDRLLASPHFGERWGRHWLDVARFAESSGGGRSMVFKEAWRYRDYVIRSLNDDKPFNEFVSEQVAGDLLPADSRDEQYDHLVATAYLILGAINYEEQDKRVLEMDVADEQLEALGRGLLGMTIGCARCHDHKFDPIPTRDYYALAGILRSTHMIEHDNVSHWIERPLPMAPDQEAKVRDHESAVASLREQITTAKKLLAKAGRIIAGPIAAATLPGIVVDDSQAVKVGAWATSTWARDFVGDGYVHDDNMGKGEKTLTFAPKFTKAGQYEVRLAYSSDANRATNVKIEVLSFDGEHSQKLNQREEPLIDGRFVSLGQFRFDPSNQWFVMVSNEGSDGYVVVDAVQFLPVEEDPQATDDQPNASDTAVASASDGKTPDVKAMEKHLKDLMKDAPERPMAMAVSEAKEVADCPICIRGNPHSPGDVVPRGFLQVASFSGAPKIPAASSGRKELAEWLTDPRNPLVARVAVNRAWHHLFGVGIVRTTDNFGATGELPSHPELLDYLATRFVADGWSTKQLIRLIVLSRAYRQSTVASDAPGQADRAQVDPDNRLLSQMNRRRLDAEAIRDTILSVSGRLDLQYLGPTVADPSVLKAARKDMPTEYSHIFTDVRRSIYTPAFRNRMHELFEVFDFADPNSVVGRRNVSTVAPQALFLLNSPFVMEESRHAATRSLSASGLSDAERVERAFRTTLGREPTSDEQRLALDAITRADDKPLGAYARLYQALFGCIDFRYLD